MEATPPRWPQPAPLPDAGVATLLAHPDEVLLRVFGALALHEQAALARVHSRFRRLFDDALLWEQHLARRFALTPAERALLEATVALRVAPDYPDGRNPAHPKRIYEYLDKNEQAALRFPVGYVRSRWRMRQVVCTRVGPVGLRIGDVNGAGNELSLVRKTATEDIWWPLARGAAPADAHISAAPDGSVVLLLKADRAMLSHASPRMPLLRLIDTSVQHGSYAPAVDLHGLPSRATETLLERHGDAAVCAVRFSGAAWGGAWLALIYMSSVEWLRGDGTIAQQPTTFELHVCVRTAAGWRRLDAVPLPTRHGHATNTTINVEACGALDDTRLLFRDVGGESSEYRIVHIDAVAGTVVVQNSVVAVSTNGWDMCTVVVPGVVAEFDASDDDEPRLRLRYIDVPGHVEELEVPMPFDAPGAAFSMQPVVGGRMLVRAGRWIGVYADVRSGAATVAAVDIDEEAADAAVQRTHEQRQALNTLAGFTPDLACARQRDNTLWYVEGTRTLVSAELDAALCV